MKPILCVGAATMLIVFSFAAFGQKKSSHPSLSVSQHAPSRRSSSALPADPDFLAAQRALFAEARGHEKQARSLYDAGDLAGAERECRRAVDTAPVLYGRKQGMPFSQRLLGRILLDQGRNQEAIATLRPCYAHLADSSMNMDVALAYARLGDYAQATKFFSDQAITNVRISNEPLTPADLPGTGDLTSLQASILFARGLDEYFEGRSNPALADLQAAESLAPANILIAYWHAHTLLEMDRGAEAVPLLERVVASPRGHIFYDAKGDLYSARAAQKAASVSSGQSR